MERHLQSLTSPLTAGAANGDTAPRPNFPISKELRDQIYGYLLNHEYIHAEPYHTRSLHERNEQSETNIRVNSAAHTYRFSTDILAVNREIADEAKKELRRCNTFVIVKCAGWRRLGRALHDFHVPVVAENQSAISRFRLHPMELQISVHDSSNSCRDTEEQSLLLLHSDLLQFSRTIRYISSAIPVPALLILKLSDTRLQGFDVLSSRVVHSSIVFTADNTDADTCDKKAALLAPLTHMRIAGQEVSFDEALMQDTAFNNIARRFRAQAAPKILWVTVLAWDIHTTALELMSVAYTVAQKGDWARACKLYTAIFTPYTQAFFLHAHLGAFAASDAVLPIISLMRVMLDATAAAGFLYLRHGEIGLAQKMKGYGEGISLDIQTIKPGGNKGYVGEEGSSLHPTSLETTFLDLCFNTLLALVSITSPEAYQDEYLDVRVQALRHSLDLAPGNEQIVLDHRWACRLEDDMKSGTHKYKTTKEMLAETSVATHPPMLPRYCCWNAHGYTDGVIRSARTSVWVDCDQWDAYVDGTLELVTRRYSPPETDGAGGHAHGVQGWGPIPIINA